MPSVSGTQYDPQPGPDPGSQDPSGSSPDLVLGAERAHLRRSREYLRLMREDVLSLRALGGDPVSEEYLKAGLYRRAEALRDLPDTPLFFGRLDYAREPELAGAAAQPDGTAGESFHVGRRHVHDPEGRPVVVDWRAPVSRPFYRAGPAEPMGLALRRRFGFAEGSLTAYEDEPFAGPGAAMSPDAARSHGAGVSRILIEEIERPRSGPMRDIVATIQPDQDDIVRAGPEQTLCVQGAPGTGKTAVGLHRVAYLLYAYPARMGRGGILVIGPNRTFLSYIRHVLPALGEVNVSQVTVSDLVGSVPVRAGDTQQAALVKGDARMAQVIRRALWSSLVEPSEGLLLARGSRRWRVPAAELADLAGELRERGVRYAAGRGMLGHRIAHVILTRMEAAGESCDDRTHDSVRRSRPVRAAVDAIWPKADPVRLIMRLLSDPEFLAGAADDVLDPQEQQAISWTAPPRGPASARWTPADAVLIDEASDLIERTPSLAHVVVDEAQDLSPMECRAVGRRCATGSATVLGDLAQGTAPAATPDWAALLTHLGKQGAGLRVLETGYRVPRQILDYAGRLLSLLGSGLDPVRSLRQDPGALSVVAATEDTLAAALGAACASGAARPGSTAVIAADQQVNLVSDMLSGVGLAHEILGSPGATGDATAARVPEGSSTEGSNTEGSSAGLVVVPVTLAKGLEFDNVIVVEPARIAAAESRGLHRLYVALTRAVSQLTVLHAESLPAALR
ncbi:MAG TPA: ATP-binding domain-containing protein [Streptosporangiaceae bacterium]|nr:ATP-binding domain-containing protein [Streptosporangiaceae bacterium]